MMLAVFIGALALLVIGAALEIWDENMWASQKRGLRWSDLVFWRLK